MIYLLTAVGLTPGGSRTVQCTFTHKQYIEQHKMNNTINNNRTNNKNNTFNKTNDTINKKNNKLTI